MHRGDVYKPSFCPLKWEKNAHSTEKDIPMQDQMPKTMVSFPKWEDEWLLIYMSILCLNAW